MELPEYSPATLAALDPATLLALLAEDEDRAPRELIDEFASRGDATLDCLGPFATASTWWLGDALEGEWWIRLHGAMALGLMSSARAGYLLAEWIRRIAEAEDDNLQDWLAGYWPALFRNKPDSTRDAVRVVAEDQSLDWYHRCGAVEAGLAMAETRSAQALDDEIDRVAAIVDSQSEDWDLRLMAATALLDYPRERHRALLMDIAAQQSPPDRMFDVSEVATAFDSPDAIRDVDRFRDPWKFYSPEEIIARQEQWAREDSEPDAPTGIEDSEGGESDAEFRSEPVRVTPSPGRNEPCPCGSGKKYKKCCLGKDTAA